ncbi:MAG: alpha/beta fold hydrolase [Deltaproteobacteria bacterium]|nr:alpha/beta fold hydrolase [Deltaproteobacteria bacterium]
MFWKPCLALLLISLFYGCNTVQNVPLQNLEHSPEGTAIQFFYETQGGKAEGYLVRPKGHGPFPLMVLLHGHSWRGDGAERLIPVAEQFSTELCYASLAISLPGYGRTEVSEDNNTDTTMRVLLDGISKVTDLPWVDRNRVMLYGFSRGALFAATLASKIHLLRVVVLHSGAYDLPRLYRDTPSQWVRRSLNPNGETNPSLFSVLPEVPDWNAPTLLLHGGNDQLVPTSQAFLLRERLEASGKAHRFVIFPDAGHRLPLDRVRHEVLSFLSQHVGSACKRP